MAACTSIARGTSPIALLVRRRRRISWRRRRRAPRKSRRAKPPRNQVRRNRRRKSRKRRSQKKNPSRRKRLERSDESASANGCSLAFALVHLDFSIACSRAVRVSHVRHHARQNFHRFWFNDRGWHADYSRRQDRRRRGGG